MSDDDLAVYAEEFRERHFPRKFYPDIEIKKIFVTANGDLGIEYNNGDWYHYLPDGSWY